MVFTSLLSKELWDGGYFTIGIDKLGKGGGAGLFCDVYFVHIV